MLSIAQELKTSNNGSVGKIVMINDCEVLEEDPAAVEQIKVIVEGFSPAIRNFEVGNCIKHIKDRKLA